MEKKKYHITIKDNETGATLTDADVNAIMGAICLGQGLTQALAYIHCNNADLIGVVVSCEQIVENTYKKNPLLPLLKTLVTKQELSRSESDSGNNARTESDKRFDEFLRNLFGGG